MNDEIEVLKIITRRLDQIKISYMITGSIAVNFYSVPRMTRDIDIVIELKEKDKDRIVEAFKNDFYIDEDMVGSAIVCKGMFNIIHNDRVIKVDFIIRKESEYRLLEFQRRRHIKIEGQDMWIVAPEDLILSKLFWVKDSMSELHLGDIKNILSDARNVDIKYIEKWVRSLNLQQIYDKIIL